MGGDSRSHVMEIVSGCLLALSVDAPAEAKLNNQEALTTGKKVSTEVFFV